MYLARSLKIWQLASDHIPLDTQDLCDGMPIQRALVESEQVQQTFSHRASMRDLPSTELSIQRNFGLNEKSNRSILYSENGV
jgi:hypothetical protein